ncbi:aminotransferase class-III [Tolypothrix tenuis PCC 7101]|uniref:Aminotransferase class-III n=1 Tax=Tolypothrix tenuis PCC 7101 TaxID=231146 RepID=A0A1Z4N1I2_9CYAN|nr:aspartate aminotransferase family protein [Aulosira sp. FACHB-113]BAY99583.1 aminotransferase class-III [Tolypothrix tenuis PCC 7101]BAZ76495.1 aminotransferase class-III [Aulosira laxa NIES-50]
MQKIISKLQQPHSSPEDVQKNYLQQFINDYNQLTKTSKQLTQNYRFTLADSRVPAGFNLALKEMCYPIVAKKSCGSRIWDVDGNEYVDVTMGFGINLFGHNPSFVKTALIEQLEQGIQLGPQTELAGEVAELIAEMTGMERVAFSNTGTEAVMSAIRIARAATNRNKIAIFSGSYHGHSDATLVDNKEINGSLQILPTVSGVPPKIAEDVLVLDYGNPQSLALIETYKHELAAVLVEPVQTSRVDLQPQEFLHQLRQLTTELDIALIFDEMVTGFRIHPGGAQAWFGVKADIATYGKIVGGGLPIGVIAGKAAYMDKIDGGMWHYGDASFPKIETTLFAGTHCKHPLSLAAAKAVLKYLKTQGATLQSNLNQRTAGFVNTLNAYFEAEKIPVKMINFGSLFGPATSGNTTNSEQSLPLGLSLLTYHLIKRGFLSRGGSGFLSTAHTDEDINYIIQAVKNSINDLRSGYFL